MRFDGQDRVVRGVGAGRRWPVASGWSCWISSPRASASVEDLAAVAGLNLTTVSAHLQALKQAGMVADPPRWSTDLLPSVRG
jgi:DNA-binding transcriptional ArsR family regulator